MMMTTDLPSAATPSSDTPTVGTTPPKDALPPTGFRPASLLPVLLGDLVGPMAVFYAARSLGAATGLALVLGGLTCLLRQVAELVRRRRVDGLGAAVLVLFVLGGVLSLATGDVRFLVVKDAAWPLAAGVVAAASCLRGKPVTFFMFRPMLTRGRAEDRPIWDEISASDSHTGTSGCAFHRF